MMSDDDVLAEFRAAQALLEGHFILSSGLRSPRYLQCARVLMSPARAARLKWWTTDLQVRTADRCLQLHGGYGYMREYSVARAFVDARIQTIYGGTNEIMKTIIAKDLGI